jgi:hypothetical protein
MRKNIPESELVSWQEVGRISQFWATLTYQEKKLLNIVPGVLLVEGK